MRIWIRKCVQRVLKKSSEPIFEIDTRSIEQCPKIGHGSTCYVYAVRATSGTRIAVKRVSIECLEEVQREVKAYNVLRSENPHVVRYFGLQRSANHVLIGLEMASDGVLLKRVQTNALTEAKARMFFRQMTSAVSYIHSRLVVHRDIKLENWLLFGNDRVKLSDFGLSHVYAHKGDKTVAGCVGSMSYCMPEVLTKPSYDGTACDVWSLCVCLFAMVCGFFPYAIASAKDTRFRLLYGVSRNILLDLCIFYDLDCCFSPELCDLMQHSIAAPKRHDLRGVQRHQWVAHSSHATNATGSR